MKKLLITLFILLTFVALVGCNDNQNIDHEHAFETVLVEDTEPCKTVTTTKFICSCGYEEVKSTESTTAHKFSAENDYCDCGEIEVAETYLGEGSSEFEQIIKALKEAQKKLDYDEIKKQMDNIIAYQDGSFCIITKIIFIGSVSLCTTDFIVNETSWSSDEINEKAFANQFLYSDIQSENVKTAIKKATNLNDYSLRNMLVTIAFNSETNGYEFYLEKKL